MRTQGICPINYLGNQDWKDGAWFALAMGLSCCSPRRLDEAATLGRKNVMYITVLGSLVGVGILLVDYFSTLVNSVLLNLEIDDELHNPVEENVWKWMKPPPPSRRMHNGNLEGSKSGRKKGGHHMSVSEKLLKEFSRLICRKVMTNPLTTPCAHNFCKSCLLESYTDQSFMRERSHEGGRTLRAQKVVKKCPNCTNDISDFLQNPQVNREIMDLIESLQQKAEEENADKSVEEESDVLQKSGDDGSSGKVNGYASDSGVAEKSEYESNDTKKAAISKKESDAEDSELQSA